ncbi:MAG: ATP-binding cassette domain-containing protein [Rhodobacteraceae bacterium]|nr:ATP-binding cassette domain-containing protein [Paracoccaceae bacterium]
MSQELTNGLILTNGLVTLQDGDRTFRLEIKALTLVPGRAVALTGASGSGKTLMLELLGLLRAPGPGTCYEWRAHGALRDLAGLWQDGPRAAALAHQRGALFGFIPQSGGLLPFLSVTQNVELTQKINKCLDADWTADLIARLGLADVAHLSPGALSIGQRQRTAIARALAHRPPFVIADEPTAALDPESADTVLRLLLDIAATQNCGVILSSHDIARIDRFDIPRLSLNTSATGKTVTSTLEDVTC